MAVPLLDPNAPDFTRRYVNLPTRLGAQALEASDDFFAPKDRMLNPEPAVFIPGKYDDHGKWMDGWETRRKRTTGYDWCIVKLARPGVIKGFDIDTSHFTGNFPPAASIEAAFVADGAPTHDRVGRDRAVDDAAGQQPSLCRSERCACLHAPAREHLSGWRHCTPARDGQPQLDWAGASATEQFDLAAMENGGYVVAANNQHFGVASNLLLPGRA